VAALHISLLGGFEARLGSGETLPLKGRKTQALVAYLALGPDQPRSREELAGLLWGDRGEEQARSSLRQSLSELRKALSNVDGSLLIAGRDTVSLNSDALEVDVSEFERLIDEGTPAALEKASELYRGDLLDGVGVHDSAFEDWLRDERQRLNECACEALSKLLDHQTTQDREIAIATARRLLALDPLREATHRALMRLYAGKGERTLALKQYQACRDLLAAELGISPEAETKKLAEEVRRGGDDGAGRLNAAAELQSARSEALPLPDKPSIAVLPFVNMSGDAEQQYFSDGITEDIITELSRFRDLFVIARHSSFAYRDNAASIEQVGRDLGVHYLLEGSVRKAGKTIRVSAQLVDAMSSHHLWAERYDRELEAIFAVQDEITQTIVATLAGRVEDATRERAKRKNPDSLAAYDYVLRGDEDVWVFTKERTARSRQLYQKAIELDSQYARAYAGVAHSYLSDWGFAWGESPDDDLDRALKYAQKAVALDDSDNRSHFVLAYAHVFQQNFVQARIHRDKAIALNPNDADVIMQMAFLSSYLGRHGEAIEMGEKAIRLNPYHPPWYLNFLGSTYYLAHQYSEAIAALEGARDALPDTAPWLAASYAQAGRLDEAHAEMANFATSVDAEPWWLNVPESTAEVEGDPTGLLRYMVYMYPFKNPADLDHLLDGLRKAEPPE
jgi:TolB-like protein